MADRNDELLLALGWEDKGLDGIWFKPGHLPILSEDRPRPYDNLQDAVDCVPDDACWQVNSHDGIACTAEIGMSKQGHPAKGEANTPAEALAEAILKAVNHG